MFYYTLVVIGCVAVCGVLIAYVYTTLSEGSRHLAFRDWNDVVRRVELYEDWYVACVTGNGHDCVVFDSGHFEHGPLDLQIYDGNNNLVQWLVGCRDVTVRYS